MNSMLNCYCQKCEIYMCNKFEKHHLSLFPNHNSIILDKDIYPYYLLDYAKLKIIKIGYISLAKIIMNYVVQIVLAELKEKDLDSIVIKCVCNYEDILDEKKQNLKNYIN